MEEKDIDILIGMIEKIVDAGYLTDDGDIRYSFGIKFKYDDEPNLNEIKSFLDKIGVKYHQDDDLPIFLQNLRLYDGGEQKIKDWVKENSEQLTEYIKTKDKKTIGKFALIFGETLDDDLLKEIVESKEVWDEEEYKYHREYGLDNTERGKVLCYVKDVEYKKKVLENISEYELSGAYDYPSGILISINDIDYIKKWIDNSKVSENSLVRLLEFVNDPSYIEKILEEGNYHFYREDVVELVQFINKSEFTKHIIENAEKYDLYSFDILYLLRQVKDIEFTKHVIENAKNYDLNNSDILDLLEQVKDIEFTKHVIENAKNYDLDSSDIRYLLLNQVKDIEFTKRVIENAKNYDLDSSDIRYLLLNQVKDIEFTKHVIENAKNYGLDSSDIRYLLLNQVKDIEFTKHVIENAKNYGLDSSDVRDLLLNQVKDIEFKKDVEFTKRVIENAKNYDLKSSDIRYILEQVKDIEFTKKIIKNREEYGLSTFDAVYFIEENNLIQKVEKKEDLKEILTDKEISEYYRRIYASVHFIKEHLSEFIEIEGANNIEQSVLLKMAEKNEEILKGNFDILAERYINILGTEKINQISCYSDTVKMVLRLSNGELELLRKILDKYMDITKGEEWTPLANKILENIDGYRDLVSNIEENENFNIDKLMPILIHSNDFNIKTIEDVENFQEIKRKKCEDLMNGETIKEKQKGVLLKIFGQGLRETKEIIEKFGDDIDEIEDEDLKAYIKSLQEILQTQNPKVLEEIFKQVEELENINPLLMERMLKTEYWKLYNKDLFKLEKAEKLPEGENLYSAGTDFKMIITSVGAYWTNEVTDYKEDWNRPAIGSQHFCASYIRNDMLGHAPIPHICYGFSEMKEDSLMLSGPKDIWSSDVSLESTASRNEKYLAPNNQIANTIGHNEMDFRRIQGGEKKQPDYIVVFRKNGKIKNMDTAEKASKDFGGLPIVVIDVDECLAAERKKAEELYEEYKVTGNPQVKAKLKEKLRNNRETNRKFCRDTDMDSVLENQTEQEKAEEAKVSMEDLGEIYAEVSGKEREEETKKIRMVYKEIKNIKEREDNNDAR